MAGTPASEYVAHLLELLKPFGEVTAKSMFGGFGLYREGCFFGLIAEQQVYFKVDDLNRPAFEALDLEPFRYGPKPIVMSYHMPPETALDDAAELVKWARLGFEAAQRAKGAKSVPAQRDKTAPRKKARQKPVQSGQRRVKRRGV